MTDVQIFRILRVEVSHNVQPPEKKTLHAEQLNDKTRANMAESEQSPGLLFTVNSWVFPAGLANEDPVFHFVCGERAPLPEKEKSL